MAKGKGGSGPTVDQLKLTESMYALMDKMAVSSEKIANSFETQATASTKMAENMKGMGTGEVVSQLMQVNDTLKLVVDSLKNLQLNAVVFEEISDGANLAAESTQHLNDELTGAAASAAAAGGSINNLNNGFKKNIGTAKTLSELFENIGEYLKDKHPGAVGAALGAMSGLAQSFKNLFNVGSGLLGFLGNLASSLLSIGASLLMVPIKMFNALTEAANTAGGGGGGVSELTQAINDLRKAFGALTDPTNKAILTLSKSMNSLKIGSISARQAFGTQAEMIKLMTELFDAGGAAIRNFSKEIVDGNGAVLVYQKALGITNEDMGALAMNSKMQGKTLTKTLNEIAKYSDHMGKRFGIDSKIISQGMAKAAADTKNFGHLSQKELAVAVAYSEKLGISIDKMAGIFDSMSTFEDAAEAVATLNSNMNTNIDLSEVMQETEDVKIFEIFKKGLKDAGHTVDSMDARTRKLIKTTLKLSEEQFNAMVAADNQKNSLKDVAQEGDKAAKKELTQAEAFSKLADAIDRVFPQGGGGGADRPKTFFEALTKGFEKGINKTKEMQRVFQNLRSATDKIFDAGQRLGQMFIDKFPGVKQFLEGLGDLFDPAKFGPMIDRFMKYFEQFFVDLDFGKLFDNISNDLQQHFGDGGSNKILEGLKKFGEAAVKILTGMVRKVTDILSKMFKGMNRKLTESLNERAKKKGGEEEILPPLPEPDEDSILTPLIEAFSDMFDQLGPLIGEFLIKAIKLGFGKLADEIDKILEPYGLNWQKVIFLYLFGPAIVQGLAGLIIGKFVPAMCGIIGKAFGMISKETKTGTKDTEDAANEGGKNIERAFEKIKKTINGVFDNLVNIVNRFADLLRTAIRRIFELGRQFVDGIVQIGEKILLGIERLLTSLDRVLQRALSVVSNFLNTAIQILETVGSKLIDTVVRLFEKILQGIERLLTSLDSLLQKALSVVGNFLNKAIEILETVGSKLIDTVFKLGEKIIEGLNKLVTALRPLGQNLLTLIGDILRGVAKIIVDVGNVIAEGVMKIVNTIMKGLAEASNSLPTIAGNIGKALGAFLQGLGTGLLAFAQMMATPTPLFGLPAGLIIVVLALGLALAARIAAPAIESLGTMFEGLGKMFEGLAPLIEKAGGAIKNVLEGFGDVIRSVGDAISKIILSMAVSIKELSHIDPTRLVLIAGGITAIATALAAFGGGSVVGAIGGALAKAIDEKPAEKIKSFTEIDTDKLFVVAEGLTEIAKAIVQFQNLEGAIENVKNAAKAAESGGGSVLDRLKDGWEEAKKQISGNKVVEVGKNMIAGLSEGVSDIGSTLADAGSAGIGWFKDRLGISSPSKEFEEIGVSIVEGLGIGLERLPDKISEIFEVAMESIKEMIDSMPESISPSVEKLQSSFSDLFSDSTFENVFSNLKDSLSDAFDELADAGPFKTPGFSERFFGIPDEVGKILGKNIKNLFNAGFDVMSAFQQGGMNNFSEINESISKNMAGLGTFFENLAKSIQPISQAQQAVVATLQSLGTINPAEVEEKINSVFKFVNAFISNPAIEVMKDNLSTVKVIQDIIGAGIVPSVKAVEDMMAAAKQIEESLNAGIQINLDAKLQAFAGKFGKIGSKGAYTVQARDVNIHVKFNVSMDAIAIEKIMVSNGSSVIKNRINLLIDATGEDDAGTQAKNRLHQPSMKL